MGMLLNALSVVLGIVSLVCFVLVVIQMFKRDESKMGIICLVTLLCCGIGGLVAFVYGWIKVTAWDLKNVMIVWTVVFVLNAILNIIVAVMAIGTAAGQANDLMNEGAFEGGVGAPPTITFPEGLSIPDEATQP